MNFYHLSGAVNGALFVLALAGLVSQLVTIRARRREPRAFVRGHATAVLSLNYFSVSFLAYFAFFAYGFAITPMNVYLVWPRLLGCVLVLGVLIEIARDRRSPLSLSVAALAAAALASGIALLSLDRSIGTLATLGPQLLSLVATALVSQSLLHQIALIRRSDRAGAVSGSLHLLTLLKDLSTVVFGLAMGLRLGWPLTVMGGASAGLKLVLLWHLYLRRHRPAMRRATNAAAPSLEP